MKPADLFDPEYDPERGVDWPANEVVLLEKEILVCLAAAQIPARLGPGVEAMRMDKKLGRAMANAHLNSIRVWGGGQFLDQWMELRERALRDGDARTRGAVLAWDEYGREFREEAMDRARRAVTTALKSGNRKDAGAWAHRFTVELGNVEDVLAAYL